MRRSILLLVLPMFYFTFQAISADVCTSTSSGNWNDAGIWSCGHVPDEDDIVTINHAVVLNSNVEMTGGSLTISPGASLITASMKSLEMTGNSTLTVDGTLTCRDLTFSADVNLSGGGTLNILRDFTISLNTAVNFDGTVTVGSELDISGNAILLFGSSVSIDGNISIRENAAVTFNSNFTGSSDVSFEDATTVTFNGDINVSGNLTNASPNIGVNSNLVITNDFTNTAPGIIDGTGSYSAGGTVTDPSSGIRIGILPVELLSFDASSIGDGIHLKWVTASEQDNNFFQVERSTNGMDFDILSVIAGSGTTNEKKEYSYIDYEVQTGTVYYRLKQVDYDGKFEYFDIISYRVEIDLKDSECSIVIKPNPCIGRCEIDFVDCQLEEQQEVRFSVYDALGNAVYASMSKEIQNGAASFSFDVSNNLAPAIYVVRGSTQSKHIKEQIVIDH